MVEPFVQLKPPVLRISWLGTRTPASVSEKACPLRCAGSFISLRYFLRNGRICDRRSCRSRHLYPLLQGSAGSLAASRTPPTTALILSASKKMKKCCCNFFFCTLVAEGKIFCLAKKIKIRNVTCEDSFGAAAAWLGVRCGLGRCLGRFLFFRGAVYLLNCTPTCSVAMLVLSKFIFFVAVANRGEDVMSDEICRRFNGKQQ